MADNRNLELALRIIASVEGLKEIGALSDDLGAIDPALAGITDRARAALNPMEGLAASSRNFGDAIREATDPLADMAAQSLKLTTVAAALATALGVKAYDESKKFESAQLELLKVIGGSRESLEGYTDQLKALALEFGASSVELTQSMANFVQAGFSADEAIGLVRESLKLMVAGGLDAAEASESIVRALKGFGAGASDASRLVDVLNATSNKYATDVRQLAEGMQRVAPVAQQMGLSFEKTAGILTPMIESFGSGAEAAEAFRTGVLKLIDDAAPVREALTELGVAQQDANGQLRTGEAILYDVMRAFTTADESQKLYLTSQLAGIDQAPRLIKVFDNLNGVLDISRDALNANGSAQQEVNIRLQSAETIAKRTEESFSQLAAALGTHYRDAVKGVSDSTGELARAFLEAEKAGSFDGLLNAVRPQLESLENLFRQTAKNLPAAFAQLDWGPLTGAIADLGSEVGDALHAMVGEIDLSTVEGLRGLLQRLADGMAALIRFTAGVVDQMGPLFSAFGQLAAYFADNADGSARFAGEVAGLGLTVNKIVPVITSFTAETFSLIGAIAEVAFKVGILVAGIKLLNLAGVSVLPMLGSLATALGGLSVSTATVAAAFAGFPGVLLALVGAAGAAGYALGTGLSTAMNAVLEPLTGGSLGTLIYDLAEGMGLTAEQARAAAEQEARLARVKETLTVSTEAFVRQLRDQLDAQLAITKIDLGVAIEQEKKLVAQLQQRVRDQEFIIRTNERAGRSEDELADHKRELEIRQQALALATEKLQVVENRRNAILNEQGRRLSLVRAEEAQRDVAIQDLIRNVDKSAAAEQSRDAVLANSEKRMKKGVELFEDNVTAAKKYADTTEDLVKAELDGLRAEIALAEAKGDTATAQRLGRELALKEAEGAVRVALAKQAEQEMEYALAVAKRNQTAALVEKNQATKEDLELADLTVQKELAEAQAAGINTQAQEVLLQKLREIRQLQQGGLQIQQQVNEQTEQNTENTKDNTDANEGNAKSYTLMENAAVGAIRELSGLSAGMEELISQMLHVDGVGRMFGHEFRGELGKLQLQLNQTNQALEHNARIISPLVGLGFERMANVANKARQMYLEQAIAATELAGRLQDVTDSADGNQRALQDLVNNAQRSITAMRLLDQETLDRLQSAIDAANDKLREMQEETQSARDRLAEMNAELLEAQGLDAKAELLRQQLDYQQQLADIEAQRQEAELSGNRELLTILAKQQQVLEQINRTKITNIEADAEAERAQDRIQRGQQQTANNVTPINRAGGGKTYNLNLVGVRGQTLNATTDTDPSAFLTALEDAQRRGMIQ